MSRYVSEKLREKVATRAGNRCEYCGLPQIARTAKHQIEHILPLQHNGLTIAENLALACSQCNLHKGPNIAGYDVENGQLTPLFNPRMMVWTDHFLLEEVGEIVPLTAEARVTVRILKLNDEERCDERRALIEAGIY